MRIGLAKEIKPDEYRVALTPAWRPGARAKGHEVLVETEAGSGSTFGDPAYAAAGAEIVSQDDLWESAELLLKERASRVRISKNARRTDSLHLPPHRSERPSHIAL